MEVSKVMGVPLSSSTLDWDLKKNPASDALGVRKPPSSDPLRGSKLFLDILMDQVQAKVDVEI